MKLKVAAVIVLVLLIVGVLSAYVALAAGRELFAARSALAGAPQDLDEPELRAARDHLRQASQHLGSIPARLLGIVPFARQNLAAVRTVTEAAIPVLTTGLEVDRKLGAIEERGLIRNGLVHIDLIEALRDPLEQEAQALQTFERRVSEDRNGWLLPPLWDALDQQVERAGSLRAGAEGAADATRLAPALLGAEGDRTYLVLMLNNAELRGAGGILSGIGTLSTSDGKLRLGDFSYYRALADDPPYRSVPAPKDFEKHFAAYDAATTRWVATSSSPDVPDVAAVARRLYDLVRGVNADGALIVDARGLAALMPPHARVPIDGGGTLTKQELPRYVYEGAYRDIDVQVARRDALVGVGKSALATILRRGIGGRSGWASAAEAAGAGHLRFVSFNAGEGRTLDELGVTGELGSPEDDGALVTVQNYGGTKLDFYSRRAVRHACKVTDGGPITCATQVSIRNQTPNGLPRFVYQYRPYGLFKNFIEVYVPRGARLTGVTSDGEPANFATAREDGYTAVGVYERIPRGQKTTVTVSYRLDGRDSYSLVARPQPLAQDASFQIALEVPTGWSSEGEGELRDGVLRWSGDFDRTLRWRLAPSDRTGLAALWPRITRFWTEPVF